MFQGPVIALLIFIAFQVWFLSAKVSTIERGIDHIVRSLHEMKTTK